MELLVLTVALLGSLVESQYPYAVPPYFVVTQNYHDMLTSGTHLIPIHQPHYHSGPHFVFPRYIPINGAWMGSSHSAYQQPINNLPPLPPIPAGYPPLPSIPPPGGSGAVVVTPGGGGGTVTPVQPPRPVQPPVVVPPPTTPRPSVPVTLPPPTRPPSTPAPPVVIPTTPRPVQRPSPKPIVPVTVPPPRPVVTPRPVPVQPPQDDDDDIADPISNPPVLSAARNPSPFHLYYDNPGDFFIDPRYVVDIKSRSQ
ncbi:classical arabinogalactan protein 9 [Galendromus occidentalis]|uniref:Classical arabinogalactan protein 9 n=1 Tax=Galendromus occidentalis TaxID=34638 RepID=A0AAJ6QSS9_9ACAR|nr:classical arabinogalactan protein 9 [Galendromus occidentalis]